MMGRVVSRNNLCRRKFAKKWKKVEQATVETHHGRCFDRDGREL